LSAVAKAALKFCGASDAQVSLREGDEWFVAAHEGPIGAVLGRRTLTRHTAPSRAMIDGKVVQITDLQSVEADEFPEARELGTRLGFRSALAAPLLRDDVSIGAISLRRREAGEFSPRQVELLKTFAAQAVIAIENVRLFTELRESLEQQTASAEILEVISQSPTDVEPVLKAVVGAARRFCGADDAMVVLREETEQLLATHEGSLQSLVGTRLPLDRSSATGRATIDGQTFHVPDVAALDPAEHAMTIELTRRTGIRSLLAAPMLREGQAIGCVLLRRPTPGAFTPRQIELLEAFAAQAVIAIENVRLFTELRDSLGRLKAAQANLIQAEKMASLGQLSAGIAHEIKNPLNFVNNFAGLSVELLGELKAAAQPALAVMSEDARAEFGETIDMITSNLGKIAEHGRRADGIVKSMLSHSRGGTGDWQQSDINALIEEALNLAYHGARAQDKEFNVTLERDFAPEAKPIEVVPQDVTRVFLNLFGNGFYAANKRRLAGAGAGYRPTLTVSTRDLGEAVEVRVRDNGIGISPELRDKLFQPFFTTKPTGEGTGLGLSISYDIVTQQHGGSIEVESEPGSFTEFTVRLPRRRRAA
jgi:signal transduction histidine kinase